jgi:mannose-1-phosphate guanylyltransferase
MSFCNWAAILAGGEGARLQAFTRVLTGDDRPKQFCRLLGSESLINETRARLCLNVEPEHTVCVVTKKHEPFYAQELRGLSRSHLIEQPSNRGTAPAIAATLIRLRHLSEDCVVGFFPADHYYRDICAFRRTIAAAYAAAHSDRSRVFLVGAEATEPEVEYGWIQPGRTIEMPRVSATQRMTVREVEAFHEKPSVDAATDLLARRCLWNTFVLVGSTRAFESLIASSAPEMWDAFGAVRPAQSIDEETSLLDAVYPALTPVDFSQTVLEAHPERLGVISLPASGWTDLGQPSRVLDVLAARGPRPPRRRLAAS